MTDHEILVEIFQRIIGPFSLARGGGDRVIAYMGGAALPSKESRFRTEGAIPLYFTLGTDGKDGAVTVVHQIGSRDRLDALPRGEVVGSRALPARVFRPDDPFIADYGSKESVKNYNVYMEIAEQIQAKRIFEIGVRAGYSAYSLLVGAPGASYYGLDLDQGTFGGEVGYPEHARRMLAWEFPAASITIEYGDSQGLWVLPGGRYDLTHVDGNHSHDGTLHDLELAARSSDWVVIDDVDFIPTVASALEEFLGCYPVPAIYYPTWRGHVLLETRGTLFGN